MQAQAPPRTVSFDVYSALIDSRSGGARAFAALAEQRGWAVDASEAYARWDAICKDLQRRVVSYVSFRALAGQAMEQALTELGLDADPRSATEALLATIGSWPHYDDVPDAVAQVAQTHPVALLTNIDDDLLARTVTGYPFTDAITSEAARCYKPSPEIYRFAERRLGPLVHVAASARDVRGSLEAGLDVVRVVRPGHRVDPEGPQPQWVIDDLGALPETLARLEDG